MWFFLFFFFFSSRRRHTRCGRDWSSDVCSSDLDPREPATIAAMKATGLVLGGRTSLWNAWVGLNAILGLFLLLFAATYLLLAVRHMSLLRDSPTLAWLPVAGGVAYLAIALRFGGPIIEFAVATACFLVAALALGSSTLSQNAHKSTGYQEGR